MAECLTLFSFNEHEKGCVGEVVSILGRQSRYPGSRLRPINIFCISNFFYLPWPHQAAAGKYGYSFKIFIRVMVIFTQINYFVFRQGHILYQNAYSLAQRIEYFSIYCQLLSLVVLAFPQGSLCARAAKNLNNFN